MKPAVAIVGGGAAGLFAAVTAAKAGAKVTVLEKADRVGRKLLATGNGRCNLTNLRAAAADYHTDCPAAVKAVLEQLPPAQAVARFKQIGLLCREEEEGRVYPYSAQAAAVLDRLRFACAHLGVETENGISVKSIEKSADGFLLTDETGRRVRAGRVLLAAGGAAAPQLGGSSDGCRLLERFGHTVTPLTPALTPVKTDPARVKPLKGVRVRAAVTLFIDGTPGPRELGEVQFTEQGLSGIAVMQLSSRIGADTKGKHSFALSLDLMPDFTREEVHRLLTGRLSYAGEELVSDFMIGLLPKRVGQMAAKEAGACLSQPAGSLPGGVWDKLARTLKDWRFEAKGTLSWPQAQVMAGGARLCEFDPYTLQSNRVVGLYAAGEVLNVDGPCGGYNLQWAWASGFAAGRGAATEGNRT